MRKTLKVVSNRTKPIIQKTQAQNTFRAQVPNISKIETTVLIENMSEVHRTRIEKSNSHAADAQCTCRKQCTASILMIVCAKNILKNRQSVIDLWVHRSSNIQKQTPGGALKSKQNYWVLNYSLLVIIIRKNRSHQVADAKKKTEILEIAKQLNFQVSFSKKNYQKSLNLNQNSRIEETDQKFFNLT